MTDKATHTPLPCEDCGSTDLEVCWTEIGSTKHWHVLCNDCSNERSGFTEAEALTAWNTRAVNSHHDLIEALRWYADQFCELGTSHECCGRLTPDECSGCKARAILTKEIK